jgi:hypothetical protein
MNLFRNSSECDDIEKDINYLLRDRGIQGSFVVDELIGLYLPSGRKPSKMYRAVSIDPVNDKDVFLIRLYGARRLLIEANDILRERDINDI